MNALKGVFVRVAEIISEHNSAIGGEGKPGFVAEDTFVQCIKAMGGTSEDRLKRMSYEDILQCMPSIDMGGNKIKPIALAKAIAAVFRGNEEEKKRPVSSKKASIMSMEELVKAFDPEEPTNSVGKRLKSASKGERFIVFESGRIVDVETTLKLLNEVKGGFKGRERIAVSGEVKEVYRVGQLPDAVADENPLYRGRPLRPDGTCDQTGRSWEGITLETRQLVRIAVDVDELDISLENAHNVIDLALKTDANAVLRQRYQKAAAEFTKLSKIGKLPTLVVPMRTGGGSGSGVLRDGKKVILG